MSRSFWNPAIALSWVCLSALPLHARGDTTNLFFADGRIACEITSRGEIPQMVLTTLPIAMQSALEHIGAPRDPARLTIRLQPPPPFHQRAWAWFRAEALASQMDDEILLQPGTDPLKLAFRLGHELSHWLVYKRYPIRPPLWLDEGLAQMVAAEAASTCARTLKQDLERPLPAQLNRTRLLLDELIRLQSYPKAEARSAAFYWQAEKLVQSIRGRLGPAEFFAYLDLLCSPSPPAWDAPLRERWYFSDWDMNWLAEQIQPNPEIRHVP